MLRSPIFYGVLTFGLCMIFFALVLPVATCIDGWVSPSIGLQGACSHHGGVNNIPSVIGAIFSFCSGVFVWHKANKKRQVLESHENKKIEIAEQASKGLLSRFNFFLCKVWNLFVRILKAIKVLHYTGRNPWILGSMIVFISILFPPICFILYPISIAALINNADTENDFLIRLD